MSRSPYMEVKGTHVLTGLIWVVLTGCHSGREPSSAAAHGVALRKRLSLLASSFGKMDITVPSGVLKN